MILSRQCISELLFHPDGTPVGVYHCGCRYCGVSKWQAWLSFREIEYGIQRAECVWKIRQLIWRYLHHSMEKRSCKWFSFAGDVFAPLWEILLNCLLASKSIWAKERTTWRRVAVEAIWQRESCKADPFYMIAMKNILNEYIVLFLGKFHNISYSRMIRL